MVKIKRKVVRQETGWTVKEVRELIRKEGHIVYTERHILRLMQKWGIRAIVPDKRLLRKASREERLAFKKQPKGFSTTSQEASP
jgi:transposase